MLEDKRSLDGIYGTRRYVGSPLELACAYCVQFFRFQSRSQILGQPYQLDTSPKGAERHPRVPFLVYDNVRVDGIKVVMGMRHDNRPGIRPRFIRVWIQSLAIGMADGRSVLSESGTGIKAMVISLIINDIRCPRMTFISLDTIHSPLRRSRKNTVPDSPFG